MYASQKLLDVKTRCWQVVGKVVHNLPEQFFFLLAQPWSDKTCLKPENSEADVSKNVKPVYHKEIVHWRKKNSSKLETG